ncbi:MAG: hypothetical protein K2H94_02545, partial [Duncaniella sp.]|nr:hypothetical protein [Duncaniella sp.]
HPPPRRERRMLDSYLKVLHFVLESSIFSGFLSFLMVFLRGDLVGWKVFCNFAELFVGHWPADGLNNRISIGEVGQVPHPIQY